MTLRKLVSRIKYTLELVLMCNQKIPKNNQAVLATYGQTLTVDRL